MSSVSDQDIGPAPAWPREPVPAGPAARRQSDVRRLRPGRHERLDVAAQAEVSFVRRAARRLVDLLLLCRVQLLGALLIAVLMPALVRWQLDWAYALAAPSMAASSSDIGIGNAVLGSAVATLLGFITWRQMRTHPGAVAGGYVLYAFAMSYGILGVALLFIRADYSRFQILSSFLLTVAWFLIADYATRRRTVLRLAYTPGVKRGALATGARVSWYRLVEPRLGGDGISGVVADLRSDLPAQWERFLARCALDGVPIYDVRQINEVLTGQVKVEHLSENTLPSTLARVVYVRAKRLTDLAMVVLAAPVFAPVIALTAIAIRLESPGPAFFSQVRMGHRGRTFVIHKLRSMRTDLPEGLSFTSDNDPRITRIGAFIRKYRIDEFPQIWNILKGEMSWIGPRPEAVDLADWYEREVPFYCYRHMVRPGITGWAQVNQGYAAQVDAAREKLHYDFYYIKNISPWLDLLIAAKTLRTMLTGFGSR